MSSIYRSSKVIRIAIRRGESDHLLRLFRVSLDLDRVADTESLASHRERFIACLISPDLFHLRRGPLLFIASSSKALATTRLDLVPQA